MSMSDRADFLTHCLGQSANLAAYIGWRNESLTHLDPQYHDVCRTAFSELTPSYFALDIQRDRRTQDLAAKFRNEIFGSDAVGALPAGHES